MNKTTIHFNAPVTVISTTPVEEQRRKYYKRKKDVELAVKQYPHIFLMEDAYFAYCRENNVEYIPLSEVHVLKANAMVKQALLKEQELQMECPSCHQLTVTIDNLCPSCPQFAQGFRSSLLCSHCLLTTYSAKNKQEYLAEYALRLAEESSRRKKHV